ncbi:hypothetical protein CBM2598_U10052 [Cupriavidus taiwanensis]|uniref:Uncharacterized protein n=1 Tax=Cupriavidus taiwanensis TaxID=164546 RepID=A0A7Z7NQ28_9BURK|nr:hypothetical protein CBM2597_U10297 [Cupriavidus taiwanensis]SOZ96231.1 hypothetical protein CBM2598_U10052 [Cupriavidus taiwanensis]SPC25500.1 hypothetical protein CBM2594_U10001 [Cupriavidus taiwanensis]
MTSSGWKGTPAIGQPASASGPVIRTPLCEPLKFGVVAVGSSPRHDLACSTHSPFPRRFSRQRSRGRGGVISKLWVPPTEISCRAGRRSFCSGATLTVFGDGLLCGEIGSIDHRTRSGTGIKNETYWSFSTPGVDLFLVPIELNQPLGRGGMAIAFLSCRLQILAGELGIQSFSNFFHETRMYLILGAILGRRESALARNAPETVVAPHVSGNYHSFTGGLRWNRTIFPRLSIRAGCTTCSPTRTTLVV